MLINLIKNSDFLSFIAAIFTLTGTMYIFIVTPKYQLVRERYDKLIFPLFSVLEPYLFKPVQEEIFQQVINIVDKNKELSGGKLAELIYYCEINLSQSNYNYLCKYINTEYDKSCMRLGLKQRSVLYRINRNQYQTKLMFALYIIGHLLLYILFIMTFLLAMGLVAMYLERLGIITLNTK